MGCFNVTCTGSNLSISAGMSVKLFILSSQNLYFNLESLELGTEIPKELCSSDVTLPRNGMFIGEALVPFCLPLEGTYDDYGRIMNIVRDDTVKALEAYFGISIEEFVDRITSGRTDGFSTEDTYSFNPANMKNIETAKWLHCCFMLTEVYDHLVTLYTTSVYESSYSGVQLEKILERIGFKKEPIKEEMYPLYMKTLYVEIPDPDKYTAALNNMKKETLYTLKHERFPGLERISSYYVTLGKKCSSHYLTTIKDLDRLVKKRYACSLQEASPDKEFLSSSILDLEKQSLEEEIQEFTEMKGKISDFAFDLYRERQFKRITSNVLHKNIIYTEEQLFANVIEFFKLRQVIMALYSCDRALLPMPHGEQSGNDELQLSLVTKIQQILKRSVKEHRKEYGK